MTALKTIFPRINLFISNNLINRYLVVKNSLQLRLLLIKLNTKVLIIAIKAIEINFSWTKEFFFNVSLTPTDKYKYRKLRTIFQLL